MEIVTFTPEELQKVLEEEWKKGYLKGNVDGYYGERAGWTEKFPDE